jgi:pilus assembly protein CpaE
MNKVIRLAIVDPNDDSREHLKQLLVGIDMVWLVAEGSDFGAFADVAIESQPDVVLISLDADVEGGLQLVSRLHAELQTCDCIVTSSSQEGSLILKSMRSGAREFLSHPLKLDEFLDTLQRVQHAKVKLPGGEPRATAKVVSLSGVCGGVGCTSLAINLGCFLARNEDNNVAIIDIDLTLGDADLWLDIVPEFTIQDVAENIDRLDYALLKRSLTKHECGVYLLPRPAQVDVRQPFTTDKLQRVIALLKATFTHIIIDTSKSFSQLDIAAIDSSEVVLLMTQLDLPGLRNIVRLLQCFEQQDSLADKVRVVVNRVGLQDSAISLEKAVETLGRDVFWRLPNDYLSMVTSRNLGVPLLKYAPRSTLAREIEKLAETFEPPGNSASRSLAEKPAKRLFGFLGK